MKYTTPFWLRMILTYLGMAGALLFTAILSWRRIPHLYKERSWRGILIVFLTPFLIPLIPCIVLFLMPEYGPKKNEND